MKILFLIALAGAAGSLLRYGTTKLVNSLFPGFPWGTLAVNVCGAFLAGFLFILCRARFTQYESYFPILFVGFLGAFTTFSTFTLESVRFFMDAQYGKFVFNVTVQNAAGILTAYLGFFLASRIFLMR